jgi:hypothetical protein
MVCDRVAGSNAPRFNPEKYEIGAVFKKLLYTTCLPDEVFLNDL